MRNMTDIETAWVGAMFEGEGSITLNRVGRGYLRLSLENTDVEIISALLRLTGLGHVSYRHPNLNKLARKPSYQWYLTRQDDVIALLTKIEPYCIKAQTRLASLLESVIQ